MTARKQMMHAFLSEGGYSPPGSLDGGVEAAKPWFSAIYHGEQRTPTLQERLEFVLNFYGIKVTNAQMKSLVHRFGELGLLLGPVPTPYIAGTLAVLSRQYP